MYDKVINCLKSYKKTQISLSELEGLFSGGTEYKYFAKYIQNLVDEELLEPVKSHGTNLKPISLFNTYRIIRKNIKKSLNDDIQQYSLKVHPKIQLHSYFALNEAQWKKDLPYIKKVDRYIKEKGIPGREASSPERSYEITGDEKWIDEKGGKRILELIGLWELFKISSFPDPLMFSINPSLINNDRHIHLIVENKTTYYQLLEILKEIGPTSIIYGAGWKIVSNLNMAPQQMGLVDKQHLYYYFGDIDLEGISIWYSLYERYNAELALPFYKKLLEKSYSIGKETQNRNEEALCAFYKNFSQYESEKLKDLFEIKGYYPQEGLDKRELQNIWRNFYGYFF